jgi:hypothetical protein
MVVAAFVANAESATQAFAARTPTIRKSVAAARIHSGCGIHFRNRGNCRGFQP